MEQPRGKFIVFEGLDGSGKSTQLRLLYETLQQACPRRGCMKTYEPSDSPVGHIIRDALTGIIRLDPKTLSLLFAADRYEHITKVILPQLRRGVHVLCDRYYFSNFAYQREVLPLDTLVAFNRMSMDLLRADITVFLDTPPAECSQRIHRRVVRDQEAPELFEDAGNLVRVRQHFLNAFAHFGHEEKVLVLPATGDKARNRQLIWERMQSDVFGPDDLQ